MPPGTFPKPASKHGLSKTLSSGSATSKTCDWTRLIKVFLMGTPSTTTDRLVTVSIVDLPRARKLLTDRSSEPCPHTFGELMLTAFVTGKKIVVFSGTEHARAAAPPRKTPARNQVDPRCPTTQFWPVSSNWGFTEVGIESAHCCHSP